MDFADAQTFKAFLGGVSATGGGDTCEDVHGGLEAALNLSWSSKSRCLIHIADAPAHGSRFHNGCGDRYKDSGDPRGLQIEDLLGKVKRMGIDYTFGKINSSTDRMVDEFRKVGGSEGFVKCADMADVKNFPFAAVETISATIENNWKAMTGAVALRSARLTAVSERSSVKTLKTYTIVNREPNWNREDVRQVLVGQCQVNDDGSGSGGSGGKLRVSYKYKEAKVNMSADPFAEGSQRLSYFGIEIGRATHFFSFMRDSAAATVVFKTFKYVYEGGAGDGREDFLNLVEGQAISNYLAGQFNKVKPAEAKEVHFLDVKLVELCEDDGGRSYYTAEDIFPDYSVKFIKYNSNFGYVNRNDFAGTLNAFSHWTYDYTGHYLMVVDLQGIQHGFNQYVLTDPAVHCREPRFGSTNLGRVGMETFFEGHTCNRICTRMGLKTNRHMKDGRVNPDLSSVSSVMEKLSN